MTQRVGKDGTSYRAATERDRYCDWCREEVEPGEPLAVREHSLPVMGCGMRRSAPTIYHADCWDGAASRVEAAFEEYQARGGREPNTITLWLQGGARVRIR